MRIALEVILIVLVGWVAGAELGSWCCVQPVVAKLPYKHYVGAERAMLRTFGRIMPILMPLILLCQIGVAPPEVVLGLLSSVRRVDGPLTGPVPGLHLADDLLRGGIPTRKEVSQEDFDIRAT
jgi:hypothetical protein